MQTSNQKEPLKPHAVPYRVLAEIETDLFEHKSIKDYLVIVDYYSLFKDKSSQPVITSMKSVFARRGISDEVVARSRVLK